MRWILPMTDDKLYTSLSANTNMAKLTNNVQRTRLTTLSTDKHYSIDSEDDFHSGCRNVSHQQQFFSELPSSERLHYTNYWYSWVQTIYYDSIQLFKRLLLSVHTTLINRLIGLRYLMGFRFSNVGIICSEGILYSRPYGCVCLKQTFNLSNSNGHICPFWKKSCI